MTSRSVKLRRPVRVTVRSHSSWDEAASRSKNYATAVCPSKESDENPTSAWVSSFLLFLNGVYPYLSAESTRQL